MATFSQLSTSKKIIAPTLLKQVVDGLRKEKKSIATLNGSFDLLHAGHLYIISEAAKQAEVLIVALNSDASIRRYKSKDRPLIALQYRLEMMAALEYVDYVTWFEEDDPCLLLQTIAPDVHVNGIEYGANCLEAATLKELGSKLYLVERVPSLATSEIIEKIAISLQPERA